MAPWISLLIKEGCDEEKKVQRVDLTQIDRYRAASSNMSPCRIYAIGVI